MKKNTMVTYDGKTLYGKEISGYGLDNGYVDYKTLSEIMGNCILNNEIIKYEVDNWEVVNGSEIKYYDSKADDYIEESEIENWDDIEEKYIDIFQYYIIDNWGVEILSNYTDEIIFYNEKLDVYLWGITHWGTSWDYVLTDIKIENKAN